LLVSLYERQNRKQKDGFWWCHPTVFWVLNNIIGHKVASHTRTVSLSLLSPLSLTHTRTPSLSYTHTLRHTLSLLNIRNQSLSHTHTHTHNLSLSPSPAHTHSHTHPCRQRVKRELGLTSPALCLSLTLELFPDPFTA